MQRLLHQKSVGDSKRMRIGLMVHLEIVLRVVLTNMLTFNHSSV